MQNLYVKKKDPTIKCLLLFSPQIVHRFYELIEEHRRHRHLEIILRDLLGCDPNKQVWSEKDGQYLPIAEVILVTRSYNKESYDITVKVRHEIVLICDSNMGARTNSEIRPMHQRLPDKPRNSLKVVEKSLMGHPVQLIQGEEQCVRVELDRRLVL